MIFKPTMLTSFLILMGSPRDYLSMSRMLLLLLLMFHMPPLILRYPSFNRFLHLATRSALPVGGGSVFLGHWLILPYFSLFFLMLVLLFSTYFFLSSPPFIGLGSFI
jgi:hypothetical protein